MGDWDRLSFEDMHCGHGVHTDTGIGNCDAIACMAWNGTTESSSPCISNTGGCCAGGAQLGWG